MQRSQALALTLGTVLALSGAGAFFALRDEGPPVVVELDDHREAFDELLEARHADTGGAPMEQGPQPGEPGFVLFTPEDRATLAELFAGREKKIRHYDPVLYYRLASNIAREREHPEYPGGTYPVTTNDYGMRTDGDVATQKPDLRVLVTGDSHSEGVCSNADTFTAVLEERLRAADPQRSVETLNAAVGGYNPFHYLGVLESYVDTLRPDVFVVTVFAGNDYSGALAFERYFRRRRKPARGPYTEEMLKSARLAGGLIAQEFGQQLYFLNNPDDVQRAVALMGAITDELERLVEGRETRLVFVFLPPPTCGQPHHYGNERRRLAELLDLPDGELRVCDAVTDGWIAELEARGLDHLDLRPLLRSRTERLYWEYDDHINLAGHALIADALAELLERP